MTTFSKITHRETSPSLSARLLCLLLIGVMEFLLMTKGKTVYADLYPLIPLTIYGSLAVFWGISLRQGPRCILQREVRLGVLTAAWFLFLQLLRLFIHTSGQNIPLFLCVYLVALPFAAVTEDSWRQAGIRIVAAIYLAAAAYLLAWSIILFFGGDSPALDERLVFWIGGRLYLVHHPNTAARIFMIAIFLSLGFQEQAKGFLARGLLLGFTALLFIGQALTNSRVCTLVTCLLLGGNMFFQLWQGGRKKLIRTLVLAAMVTVAAFLVSEGLFRWNSGRLLDPTSEEAYFAANLRGSWAADLPTLNGRTLIWAGALKKILKEPAILLRGGEYGKIQLEHFASNHSHNAWLETLLRLGLPGLLLSLVFSWKALCSSLCILGRPESGQWKKNIALLTLALMITSMVEPFLFITTAGTNYFDFIFFLCLGYLTLWSRELKEQH